MKPKYTPAKPPAGRLTQFHSRTCRLRRHGLVPRNPLVADENLRAGVDQPGQQIENVRSRPFPAVARLESAGVQGIGDLRNLLVLNNQVHGQHQNLFLGGVLDQVVTIVGDHQAVGNLFDRPRLAGGSDVALPHQGDQFPSVDTAAADLVRTRKYLSRLMNALNACHDANLPARHRQAGGHNNLLNPRVRTIYTLCAPGTTCPVLELPLEAARRGRRARCSPKTERNPATPRRASASNCMKPSGGAGTLNLHVVTRRNGGILCSRSQPRGNSWWRKT